jgi:hypothetical protein
MMKNKHVERWECRKCGMPCIVEIHSENCTKAGITSETERFRKRVCVCGEPVFPEWKKIKE